MDRYPPLHLDHLLRMTDDTGLMQHALYSVPDPVHGYSVDDQARALMVCVAHAYLRGEPLSREAYTYLSYLRYAWREDSTYHNFLAYDRRWLDDRGSDDAQGRVLWALAHTTRYSPEPGHAGAAAHLFASSLPVISGLGFVRSWAFALFALYHYSHRPGGETMLNLARDLADRLVARFDAEASSDWRWFEAALVYCNGSMPSALLLAHEMTGNPRYREVGLLSLEWLMSVVFDAAGDLRLVGQDGWYPRGGKKATFDEQCVDAQGTVEAALIALRLTGDLVWRTRALAAFDWFHGRNALGHSLLDTGSWGCYDGITPRGINRNMGAESIVCYLLAYLDLVDGGLLTLAGTIVP